MKISHFILLLVPALVWSCSAGIDAESMLQDFDAHESDMQAMSADEHALELFEVARQKREEAGTLVAAGKSKDAAPLLEHALADARLAVEMGEMSAASGRADQCRIEVEHARAQWQEALRMLQQTEQFLEVESDVSKVEPELGEEAQTLPETTLDADPFPPTIEDVNEQWGIWTAAAAEAQVPVADVEAVYRRSYAQTQAAKIDSVELSHHAYVAARAVQTVECRVRAKRDELVCAQAARLTTQFGDERASILRSTLKLERDMQGTLRRELDEMRADAESRQDELYNALQQMQGKFASIHRDARGTIISLADILFDFDKATLKRDVEFNLVKIAAILNQFEEMAIVIEGHTDGVGTEEYNLELSKRRAQAVYEFLISQDVAQSRLSYEGYGESRPVADNSTAEGRQKNRRVDLVIADE